MHRVLLGQTINASRTQWSFLHEKVASRQQNTLNGTSIAQCNCKWTIFLKTLNVMWFITLCQSEGWFFHWQWPSRHTTFTLAWATAVCSCDLAMGYHAYYWVWYQEWYPSRVASLVLRLKKGIINFRVFHLLRNISIWYYTSPDCQVR